MAQNQERRVKMKKISRTPQAEVSFCSFSAFYSFYESPPDGFWAWDGSLWPVPVPFPAVAEVGWCSQLVQKGGHGSSHLRQGQERAARLPRSIAALHQRTSQDQQIVCTGHHPCPAFGALWGTEPWDVPEQFLLVEAIAMLVRVAQAIRRADLGQRSRLVTFPDKPTDLGVTSVAACSMTDDLDQRNLNEAGGAQMQVAPTPHLNLGPFGIDAFPTGIRFSVAALVFALKALPILAAGPDLAGNPCRGRTIKDAIAFDPQQLDASTSAIRARNGAQTYHRSPRMMGCNPRATNSATTACSWRAATSVASSLDFTRAVSNT